jgi:hypothetical protein
MANIIVNEKELSFNRLEKVPVLFEEADGVWSNIHGKDRPKKGRKLEMEVAVSPEKC